jgi:hypothetical protein
MGKQIAKEVLSATDQALLDKINAAVAEHDAAGQALETAHHEFMSKSKVVGALLLEVKRLHPKVADFEAFLKRVNGLHLSRAYDLMRLAGGRTTDELLRQEARDRQRKSRANKKLLPSTTPTKAEPTQEPEPLSVTEPHVTEVRQCVQEPHGELDIALHSDALEAGFVA